MESPYHGVVHAEPVASGGTDERKVVARVAGRAGVHQDGVQTILHGAGHRLARTDERLEVQQLGKVDGLVDFGEVAEAVEEEALQLECEDGGGPVDGHLFGGGAEFLAPLALVEIARTAEVFHARVGPQRLLQRPGPGNVQRDVHEGVVDAGRVFTGLAADAGAVETAEDPAGKGGLLREKVELFDVFPGRHQGRPAHGLHHEAQEFVGVFLASHRQRFRET